MEPFHFHFCCYLEYSLPPYMRRNHTSQNITSNLTTTTGTPVTFYQAYRYEGEEAGGMQVYDYGCCFPTRDMMWMWIVMFMFLVLMCTCCLCAAAFVRWVYKRRLRKKCASLRDKFEREEKFKQETEIKLKQIALRPIVNLNKNHPDDNHLRAVDSRLYQSKELCVTQSSNIHPMLDKRSFQQTWGPAESMHSPVKTLTSPAQVAKTPVVPAPIATVAPIGNVASTDDGAPIGDDMLPLAATQESKSPPLAGTEGTAVIDIPDKDATLVDATTGTGNGNGTSGTNGTTSTDETSTGATTSTAETGTVSNGDGQVTVVSITGQKKRPVEALISRDPLRNSALLMAMHVKSEPKKPFDDVIVKDVNPLEKASVSLDDESPISSAQTSVADVTLKGLVGTANESSTPFHTPSSTKGKQLDLDQLRKKMRKSKKMRRSKDKSRKRRDTSVVDDQSSMVATPMESAPRSSANFPYWQETRLGTYNNVNGTPSDRLAISRERPPLTKVTSSNLSAASPWKSSPRSLKRPSFEARSEKVGPPPAAPSTVYNVYDLRREAEAQRCGHYTEAARHLIQEEQGENFPSPPNESPPQFATLVSPNSRRQPQAFSGLRSASSRDKFGSPL